ncbi:Hpt domain-containing protein [Alteromonadaceae bacterium BrNp21-10]|nr:Hpt domain-containing protein [Alteromonadaceae bacterium BrNp21-10]
MNEHIDFDAGIKRLGGNKTLYLQLLQRFFDSTTESFNSLKDAIAIKDQQQIKMLLHSMKGASGNLSIVTLQHMLSNFERQCESFSTEECLIHVHNIQQEIQQSQQKYQQYQSLDAVAPSSLHPQKTLIECLSELETKLRNSEFIAVEQVLNLKKFVEHHSDIQTLITKIENFEYALALELLLGLKEGK